MRSMIIAAATAAALANASEVEAEDRFPTLRSDEYEWGVGIGALVEDEGYGDLGFETNGQPVIYFSSERFRFFANQFDWHFVKTDQLILSLKAEARFDGFEAEDDPLFTGMAEREGGVFAGLRGEVKTHLANVVGEWVTELSDASGGSYGSLGAYWNIPVRYGHFAPKVAIEFYDADYTDYYYGVRADEALSWRPAYVADAVVNLDVGVDYIYAFSEGHRFISSVKYRKYGSNVKDSPLIDSSGSARFILGYLYTF